MQIELQWRQDVEGLEISTSWPCLIPDPQTSQGYRYSQSFIRTLWGSAGHQQSPSPSIGAIPSTYTPKNSTFACLPILLPARQVHWNNRIHSHLLHHLNGHKYNDCFWWFFSGSNNRMNIIAPIRSKMIYKCHHCFCFCFFRSEYYLNCNSYSLRQYFSSVLSGGSNVP